MAKKGEKCKKIPQLDQTVLVTEIRDRILKGFRTKDIYEYTRTHWSLSKPQTDRYIKTAHAAFLQIDKKVKGQLRAKYRERLEMMFHDALVTKCDMRLALAMQAELNKLLNLYQDDGEAQTPAVTLVFREREDKK